jgi:hypothetical protein
VPKRPRAEYRQVGQDEGTLPYRRQWLASYTYARPELGHVGLGYAKSTPTTAAPFTTYSANYSIRRLRAKLADV